MHNNTPLNTANKHVHTYIYVHTYGGLYTTHKQQARRTGDNMDRHTGEELWEDRLTIVG